MEDNRREQQEPARPDFVPAVDAADLEQSTESQDEKYSPAYVARLFYESFRFSQGNVGLQEDIFRYLNQKHPDKLSPQLVSEGVTLAVPKIKKFVGGGEKHIEGYTSVASWSISNEASAWREMLEEESSEPHEALDLLRGVLQRDTYFAAVNRPRKNTRERTTSRSDGAGISQFVFYGLLANPTGLDEYDEMFADLVTQLPELPEIVIKPNGDVDYSLVSILEKHFAMYPDDIGRITPEGLAALQESVDESVLEHIHLAPKNT